MFLFLYPKSVALRLWGYLVFDCGSCDAESESSMEWAKYVRFKWVFVSYLLPIH